MKHLGGVLEDLRASWRCLGGVLERLGGVLKRSGASWSPLERETLTNHLFSLLFRDVAAVWSLARLGSVLEASEASWIVLEPS